MKLIYTAVACLVIVAFAVADDPNLPVFTYNLTAEPVGTRTNLCQLNENYCETNCGGPKQAPKNFCNVTTMGWGCGCSDHVPSLEGYQWPINNADCTNRGEACKNICQTSPSIPDANRSTCNIACVNAYSSKCGTPAAPAANYVVSDVSQTPTYAFGNSGKNSSTNNGTNSSGQNKTSSGSGSNSNSNSATTLPIGITYSIGSIVLTLMLVMGTIVTN